MVRESMITYIINLFESLAIALECAELAKSEDYDAIRKMLDINC